MLSIFIRPAPNVRFTPQLPEINSIIIIEVLSYSYLRAFLNRKDLVLLVECYACQISDFAEKCRELAQIYAQI